MAFHDPRRPKAFDPRRFESGWPDPIDNRFSPKRPKSVLEAFERSIMNGDSAFEYEGNRYQNTMPGNCIQVIGNSRTVRRFSPSQSDFLRNGDRVTVVVDSPKMPTFSAMAKSVLEDTTFNTALLNPFVVVSGSAMSRYSHHFTMYLADRYIEGAANFSRLFFESESATATKRHPRRGWDRVGGKDLWDREFATPSMAKF